MGAPSRLSKYIIIKSEFLQGVEMAFFGKSLTRG
jgi:hypothetical protein